MGLVDEVIDSNILIDALDGRSQSLLVIGVAKRQAISLITWMEVMAGATAAQESAYRGFLGRFVLMQITLKIAERSAHIRRTTRLKLPDAIIFATAQVHRCPLVTRNTKDFPAGTPGVRVPYLL